MILQVGLQKLVTTWFWWGFLPSLQGPKEKKQTPQVQLKEGSGMIEINYSPEMWQKGYWLVVSTHLKNISQIGSSPQGGMKIKNIWNHHLASNAKKLFPAKGWHWGGTNP